MDQTPTNRTSESHVSKVLTTALPASPYGPSAESSAPTPPLAFDPLSTTPSPDLPHPTIPGYVVLGVLGRGGMGVVYKARHLALNRVVGLKVVPTGNHSGTEEQLRFGQEAQAVARLNHPNIVQLFEVGQHQDYTYLAMEYVEGGNLFAWQKQRAIAPRVAAEIVKTLAKAMHHAHELGIVHRDLKPANILLRPAAPDSIGMAPVGTPGPSPEPNPFPYVPKITDFGLAMFLDIPIDLTAPGTTCGTPAYMSPEQIRNTKNVLGPRTDIYSLGVILYELLTGYPAFHGDDPHAIFDQALHVQPTQPRALRSEIPVDLETICLKCLEKEHTRRYPTAAALAEDLSRFLSGRPIHARPVSRAERTWRWCKRHPGPAVALTVTSLALLVTTTLSVMLWRAEGRAVAASEAEAREANRLLETLGQLRIERDALVAAKEREAVEFHRAEENLRIARDATRVTIMELTREPLLQEPKFLDVRKRLLDQAKPVFDQFVAQTTDNPAVLAEQADLCRTLAALRAMVGDTEIASRRFTEALGFYSRLTKLRPNDPVPILGLADTQLQYAFLLRETGSAIEGNRLVEDCVAGMPLALRQFPDNDELFIVFVRARLSYLHRLSPPERIRAAAPHTQAAAEDVADLTRRRGPTEQMRYLQSRVHQQLARIAAVVGTPEEAECHFLEGLALLEQVTTVATRDLNRCGELAGLHLDYGTFLTTISRPTDACGQLQTAIRQLDALLLESPRAMRFLMLWTRATVALGIAEEARGDTVAALVAYNRAAEQWLPVVAKYPEWVLGRQAARDALSRRAALLERAGNWELAAADRARHDRICPP